MSSCSPISGTRVFMPKNMDFWATSGLPLVFRFLSDNSIGGIVWIDEQDMHPNFAISSRPFETYLHPRRLPISIFNPRKYIGICSILIKIKLPHVNTSPVFGAQNASRNAFLPQPPSILPPSKQDPSPSPLPLPFWSPTTGWIDVCYAGPIDCCC